MQQLRMESMVHVILCAMYNKMVAYNIIAVCGNVATVTTSF